MKSTELERPIMNNTSVDSTALHDKSWNCGQITIQLTRALCLMLLASSVVAGSSAPPCLKCPTDAQSNGGPNPTIDVFVNRGGSLVRVSGQAVGPCETLILKASVS